jgi:hypothetical protein
LDYPGLTRRRAFGRNFAAVPKARRSNYRLRDEGFSELRCEVDPDWDGMFGSTRADSVRRNEILPLLKSVHFEILVGQDGSSLLSRNLMIKGWAGYGRG